MCPWRQDRPRFSSHSKRCPLMVEHRSQVLFYTGNKMEMISWRRLASRFQVKHQALRSGTQWVISISTSVNPLAFFAPQTLWPSPTSRNTLRIWCVWQLPMQWEWASSQNTNLFVPWEYVSAAPMRSTHYHYNPLLTFSLFPTYMKTSTNQHFLTVSCFTHVHIR